MTRAQEYALDALLRETEQVLELNRERQTLEKKGLSMDLAAAQKKLSLATKRLNTAWSQYEMDEYRKAVMALMEG